MKVEASLNSPKTASLGFFILLLLFYVVLIVLAPVVQLEPELFPRERLGAVEQPLEDCFSTPSFIFKCSPNGFSEKLLQTSPL